MARNARSVAGPSTPGGQTARSRWPRASNRGASWRPSRDIAVALPKRSTRSSQWCGLRSRLLKASTQSRNMTSWMRFALSRLSIFSRSCADLSTNSFHATYAATAHPRRSSQGASQA